MQARMGHSGHCILGSVLSHTRRSDPLKKREENSVGHFGQIRLWTSFESSPVSVNLNFISDWTSNFVEFQNNSGDAGRHLVLASPFFLIDPQQIRSGRIITSRTFLTLLYTKS